MDEPKCKLNEESQGAPASKEDAAEIRQTGLYWIKMGGFWTIAQYHALSVPCWTKGATQLESSKIQEVGDLVTAFDVLHCPPPVSPPALGSA